MTPLDEWLARRKGFYLHRTTQHSYTRDKHPCPEWDSNPRSQQPSGQDLRPRPRGHRVDWLWCGETDVSELRPLPAYCPSPGDCDVDHGVMVSTGANSYTRALWQPPVLSGGPVSRDISGVSRRMDEGIENLVYSSLWDFKSSFTCRKILRHGTFPLYFPS
jgi:hypothetical protein